MLVWLVFDFLCPLFYLFFNAKILCFRTSIFGKLFRLIRGEWATRPHPAEGSPSEGIGRLRLRV